MHNERSGWGNCSLCGERIAVKKNRSGLAYYKCDGCGVTMQHNWRKESDEYLKKHGVAGAELETSKDEEAPKAKAEAPKKAAKSGGLSEIFGD
jgi:predicted RNA-binding Zn-ribbon protein involved in translation (DUF1610 family)